MMNGTSVPHHVAIITDGNGRWAKRRMLPRTAGHRQGVSNVRRIAYACSDRGVKVLTIYSFSTENWSRTADEVGALLGLIERTVRKELAELNRRGVRFRVLGDITPLPASLQEALLTEVEGTRENSQLTLNLAVNYGGRAEITNAMRILAEDVRAGRITPEQIDEQAIADRLYTAHLPDPDLLIRTGDELRISNFLLWQLAYSELYFTPVLWPDFDEAELDRAFEAYRRRERRFGGVTDAAR